MSNEITSASVTLQSASCMKWVQMRAVLCCDTAHEMVQMRDNPKLQNISSGMNFVCVKPTAKFASWMVSTFSSCSWPFYFCRYFHETRILRIKNPSCTQVVVLIFLKTNFSKVLFLSFDRQILCLFHSPISPLENYVEEKPFQFLIHIECIPETLDR